MDCYDDDFSTIKAHPRQHTRSSRPLSTWRPDIAMGDGDRTLTRRSTAPQPYHSPEKQIEDSDDEFASAFENAVKSHKMPPQPYQMPVDAFLSDSSSKSPGRASISSLASVASTATSWDQQDEFADSDFEFDDCDQNFKVNLKLRLAQRQERAAREAAEEHALLVSKTMRNMRQKEYRRPFVEFADDLGTSDLNKFGELEGLELDDLVTKVKNGTVNKNIKITTHPQNSQSILNHQPSRMLRGMRSIAQMPKQRSDNVHKLRGAVSMLDLGKKSEFGRKNELGKQTDRQGELRRVAESGQWQSSPHLQPSGQLQPSVQLQSPTRPLTSYKEPVNSRKNLRNKKSFKLNLIRNPAQHLSKQERNGMVLNPVTGIWEGNEMENSRFDFDTVKPKLITKQAVIAETPFHNVNGMLFDNRTLNWVYANEEEYDDPFAEIDDDMKLTSTANCHYGERNFTNQSQASTMSTLSQGSSLNSYNQLGRSSIARSESTADQVFEVKRSQINEWKHADVRFMRKFGKWIGGEEEKADARSSDQHFYDMVRNA